jgi:AcrR family transcriptional regulator
VTAPNGLRARKKAAVRAALSRAAWTLMLERGLDAATPEAIAEAADVSPRTFRNYFHGREEAILDELARRHLHVVELLRARPAAEPVWDACAAVLPAAVADLVGDRAHLATLMNVVRDSPAMRAQLLLVRAALDAGMTAVVAERTGTDPERDLTPRLFAGAVGTVVGTAVEFWAQGRTDACLQDLVRDGLAQLRAGFVG